MLFGACLHCSLRKVVTIVPMVWREYILALLYPTIMHIQMMQASTMSSRCCSFQFVYRICLFRISLSAFVLEGLYSSELYALVLGYQVEVISSAVLCCVVIQRIITELSCMPALATRIINSASIKQATTASCHTAVPAVYNTISASLAGSRQR
jgi:hypothetical protein